MSKKREPKRFSSGEHKELSGTLWQFGKHLRKSLDQLVNMASDKDRAGKVRSDMMDLFDRTAGELNNAIVQTIHRTTKLQVNSKTRAALNRKQVETAYKNLAERGVDERQRRGIIIRETRIPKSTVYKILPVKIALP